MGLLAETKRSMKISSDPNNTKWSRDTNTFGQKILRSQGWQPGDYLGAKDAPHAEFHTAANASFVRVALKEDQKGLGFNKRQEDEITGLDVFSDLLSRLNGKSEGEIVEAQQARMVVKTNLYVERKWGPMRFVKGGLLVGDDMRKLTEDATTGGESSSAKKDKNSKKRKAKDLSENNDAPAKEDETPHTKQGEEGKRKSKKVRIESTAEASTELDPEEAKALRKKEKKEKKRREKEAEAQIPSEAAVSRSKRKNKHSESPGPSVEEGLSEKKQKKDKKTKKEKKEKKDEKKKKRKTDDSDEEATTGTSTPAVPSSGTATPSGSRNFVRSRFIAQKRQAVLDTKALNQIFMMKA